MQVFAQSRPVVDAPPESFRVLGARVDALTPDSVIDRLLSAVETRATTYAVFCTASTVLHARASNAFNAVLEEAALVLPDGMPLVWLGRRATDSPIERVYGPELMLRLMQVRGGNLRHYFYGADRAVLEELARRLSLRFPDLVIAGSHAPGDRLSGDEFLQQDVDRINDARPDVVWVGLGHPKQELWIRRHRQALNAPVLAGVGAAFDFLSGNKKEAPRWMKDRGLQWLHRLVKEPRRLWKRYLIGNSKFLFLLGAEELRRRSAR